MSIKEFVGGLNKDQLDYMKKCIKAKEKEIEQAGWVSLWVISDEDLNYGWFTESDYDAAKGFFFRKVHDQIARMDKGGQGKDLSLTLYLALAKYRADEAKELIAAQGGKHG